MSKFLGPLAVALMFLSAGCATSRIQWQHADATQSRFAVDRYACVQESRVAWSARGGLLWVAAAQANAEVQSDDLFAMCMQARGWTATRVYERHPDDPLTPSSGPCPPWRAQTAGVCDKP